MISTPKINNAYLGPKGYTIYKSDLSQSSLNKIKEDLTVRPKVIGGCDMHSSFPAYRESANKMYVPHYYGVANFGPPKEYKISEGTNINLEFSGKLRDYQEPVVNKFIKHCEVSSFGGGLLELY